MFLLLGCAALAGCGAGGGESRGRRYELKGKIVSFSKAQRQVIIEHEAVPGLMEAMTMPFTLRDDHAFDAMAAGDQIQATLVVDGERSWIENPVITHAVPGASASPPPGAAAEPELGAEVPDFKLVNQDGKPVSLGRYRGQPLALTFIYTRCPLPDYCPLMSENFAQVNRALREEAAQGASAKLLSVTLDPAYDTPKVLKSYGAAHTGRYTEEKFDTWEFATGAPDEIKRLASFFGLLYTQQGDQVIHSLRTAVITPDGKLYKLYRGNEWKSDELLRDLRELATSKS